MSCSLAADDQALPQVLSTCANHRISEMRLRTSAEDTAGFFEDDVLCVFLLHERYARVGQSLRMFFSTLGDASFHSAVLSYLIWQATWSSFFLGPLAGDE